MGAAAYATLTLLSASLDLDTFFGIFFQGAIAGAVGILALVLTLIALSNEEFKEIAVALRRKFSKVEVVGPEVSEL